MGRLPLEVRRAWDERRARVAFFLLPFAPAFVVLLVACLAMTDSTIAILISNVNTGGADPFRRRTSATERQRLGGQQRGE